MLKILKDEKNHKDNFNDYIEALEECKETAEKEIIHLIGRLNYLKPVLMDSYTNLNKFIEQAKALGEVNDEKLISILEILNDTISANINKGITEVEKLIEKKKKNISTFTVTLFGRTKAGKSTIREALTNGDGESIGKGAQRTTRDIKEYYWNNLRIIDTPGIGAYEGEEDIVIAESIIDETDLILFLVTNDSIQETEFERLAKLKSQNKPIVILLNVKEDIENELHRKRFLRRNKETVSLEGQVGNIERIKEYSKKYLGGYNLEIIPIHAQSAFDSTQVDNEDLSKELYNASNINSVKFMLREMIVNQGKQKRILSFRDDYIYYLNNLENIYWNSCKKIKPRIDCISDKHAEIKRWFIDFKSKGTANIDSEVSKIFTQLASEIDSFVDKYAGDKNAKRSWIRKLEAYNVEEKVNEIYKELFDEAERYLNEFARQISFETKNLNFSSDIGDIGDLKKGIVGRVVRYGAVVMDVAFVVLPKKAKVLIGIGGAVTSILSCLWGDDSINYDRKKSEIKSDMKKYINKIAQDKNKQLRQAFGKNIVDNLYKQINIEWPQEIDLLNNYFGMLKKSAINIREEEKNENISLFKILYKLTFKKNFICPMIRVAREQGIMLKILTNEDELLRAKGSRRLLESILGETIIYITFINETSELLKRALFPADTGNIELAISMCNITIKGVKENIEQIIGEKGINIRLTNSLFEDFNFIVEEI